MTTTSIVIRIAYTILAFTAANQSERPIARALGLGLLIAYGIMLLIGAVLSAGLIYWAFGIALLSAAGYAYWTNR